VKSAAQTVKSEAEGAAETVISEVKKNAGKAAKKVPKAKTALKRMVSEIDAQAAGQTAVLILASHCL
jgi:predicted component of type VI protein secretion system